MFLIKKKNLENIFNMNLCKINLNDSYLETYFQTFSTYSVLEDKEYIKSVLLKIKILKNIFNAPRIDVSFFEDKIFFAVYTDFKMFSFLDLDYSFLNERLFLKPYENIIFLLKLNR